MDFAKQAAMKASLENSIPVCEHWLVRIYYDLVGCNSSHADPTVQRLLAEYVAYSNRKTILETIKACKIPEGGYTSDHVVVFSSTSSTSST